MANIALSDLETNLDFSIHLVSNDDKHYFYQLTLPICLENQDNSIYDGNILIENNYENNKFSEIKK